MGKGSGTQDDEVAEILSWLPSLDANSLRRVIVAAEHLIGMQGVQDLPEDLRDLLGLISSEMRMIGQSPLAPVGVLRQGKLWSQVKKKAETFIEYADEAFGKMERRQRLAVFSFLIRALWQRYKYPGVRFLMQLDQVDRVIESEFPGYRSSGLLRSLVSSKFEPGAKR